MAQKRMFDKAIVDTDKFMDLPMSAKALYFLLGMEADDEGFVSYKKVVRIHGGNEDDIKVLTVKNFLIAFPSGVVVITDWQKNNYLDKNRIKETEYIEEKRHLLTKNGKYLINIDVKPMLNECSTSIVENSIEESSIEENILQPTVAEEFSFKNQLSKMFEDKNRRMSIIAYYWTIKGFNFDNKQKYSAALKRELRPAGDLIGYSNEDIKRTCEWLKNNADFKWTLETVLKYIDEPLENMKAGGKLQTEEDYIKSLKQKHYGAN